jgi:hypothetical protein
MLDPRGPVAHVGVAHGLAIADESLQYALPRIRIENFPWPEATRPSKIRHRR